jgi:hypothetical protein
LSGFNQICVESTPLLASCSTSEMPVFRAATALLEQDSELQQGLIFSVLFV